MVRGVRHRRGALHDRDAARRGARRAGLPRAGEDLRDGRRHRCGRPGASGGLSPRTRSSRSPRRCANATSSTVDDHYSFVKDLRRSVIFGVNDLLSARADLAARPAHLPQHADLLQLRHAGGGDGTTAPRAGRPGRARARQVRNDADPHRGLRAGRPLAEDLPQGARSRAIRDASAHPRRPGRRARETTRSPTPCSRRSG